MRIAMAALLALIAMTSSSGRAQPTDPDADRHMIVARYYAGRGAHAAAIYRLNQVLRQFPSSGHIEEVLARLTEEYLAVDVRFARAAQNAADVVARKREARNAAAVAARKFPNGPWAAYALRAFTAARLEPAEDEQSWLSRTFKW